MSTAKNHEIRDKLKKVVIPALRSGISKDEVDRHFNNMPDSYWERVTANEVACHLEMQSILLSRENGPEKMTPVIRWRHFLESDYSEVIVMTWNRHGLLAKMAGAFAASNANVFEADVYTRKDNVILDLFKVCDSEYRRIRDRSTMEKIQSILAKSVSKHADLPFEEMTDSSGHGTHLDDRSQSKQSEIEPRIEFDNQSSPKYTFLNVGARDHVGLLHDILQVLSLSDVNIDQAKITTEKGMARDQFYLTDLSGEKIKDAEMLSNLRQQLLEMIQSDNPAKA